MKIKKNMVWEIVLFTLSGLVTIGIGVKSVIDKAKSEKENAAFQEKITTLTEENNKKANRIESLQQELKQKSDELIELHKQEARESKVREKRRANPIPKEGRFSADFIINLSEEEKKEISSTELPLNRNLLSLENIHFYKKREKYEYLLNGKCKVHFNFSIGDKYLNLKSESPANYISGIPLQGNTFLYADKNTEVLKLSFFNIDFKEDGITSNSDSLYDFINCQLMVKIQFLTPILFQDVPSLQYMYLREDLLNTSLLNIQFHDGRNDYRKTDFSATGSNNEFTSDFQFILI